MRPWLAPVLMACVMGNTGCPHASDFMRLYGYTEIRPPSGLLRPGSLVAITRRNPFEAKMICDAQASLGPEVSLVMSQTASGTLKKMQGQSSSLDASVLGMIKENARYKYVQNIDVTLQNVSIVEITDAAILESLGDRSDACAYAVRQRVSQGYTITMISSALVADVSYTVNWNEEAQHELTETDKLNILHELSATLGGTAQQVTTAEIHATGLIWGIRDDEYLSALSIPFVDEQRFARNTRQIDVDKVVVVVPPPLEVTQ